MVPLSDDKFVILGGYSSGNWKKTTEYCSFTSGCTRTQNLPEEAYYPEAIKISEDLIFVKGSGLHSWFFNLTDSLFYPLPDALENLSSGSLGFINGHEVVIAGGSNTKKSQIVDLDTYEWRFGPDLPVFDELSMPAAVQFEDSFLVMGGWDTLDHRYQDRIFKFDPVNYEWEILPHKLQMARSSFTAILVPSSYIPC